MKRTMYAVKTDEGFVGNNYYRYGNGSISNRDRPFEDARLFKRERDAYDASKGTDKIMEVEVTLKGSAEEPAVEAVDGLHLKFVLEGTLSLVDEADTGE